MRLIIANKNYSSWSFRPWIAMKALGIPFDELVIPFGEPIGNPEFKAKARQYSPAEKLPVLVDGDTHVWETLAIMEYLAEKFPAAGFWPKDAKARTEARVLSSEMHAGFAALRGECQCSMSCGLTHARCSLPPAATSESADSDTSCSCTS